MGASLGVEVLKREARVYLRRSHYLEQRHREDHCLEEVRVHKLKAPPQLVSLEALRLHYRLRLRMLEACFLRNSSRGSRRACSEA